LLTGVSVAPVCYLLFALAYVGKDKWLKPKYFSWLFVVPLLTLIIAYTNAWHHWMWISIEDSYSPYNIALYRHGPAYWVGLIGYSYTLFIIGTITILHSLTKAPPRFRSQGIAIVIGSIIPFAGSLLYVEGLSPISGFDLTPLCLAISGILFCYTIARIQLLDLVPIARAFLIEYMTDGVLVFDQSHRLIDFNPVAQSFTQGKLLIGMTIQQLPDFWRELRPLLEGKQTGQRLEITKPLPTLQVLDARITKFSSSRNDVTGSMILIRDISTIKETELALRAANERLMDLTTRDSLTGLYNRKYLLDTLDRELARAKRENRPLSFMIISLDHFKSFNEQHGVQAGEAMLQGLGFLMKRHTRVEDIASRFGGEEFCLLMTGSSVENAFKRGEILRKEFELFGLDWVGSKLVATISIGIAAFPIHGSTGEEIVREAQSGLHLAKVSGCNCSVVSQKLI